MNHLDTLEQLVRRWDAVMCDIDHLPDEAARQPTLEARACYLKALGEIARCAANAHDDLARRLADDVRAHEPEGVHIPCVGTLHIAHGDTRAILT